MQSFHCLQLQLAVLSTSRNEVFHAKPRKPLSTTQRMWIQLFSCCRLESSGRGSNEVCNWWLYYCSCALFSCSHYLLWHACHSAAHSVGVQREHCFLVLHLFQLRLSLTCIICSFFFYVTENIHDAPFWQLILILEACHSLQYRNIKLFSTVADYVNSVVCLLDKRQVSLRPSTL